MPPRWLSPSQMLACPRGWMPGSKRQLLRSDVQRNPTLKGDTPKLSTHLDANEHLSALRVSLGGMKESSRAAMGRGKQPPAHSRASAGKGALE